MLHWRYFSWHPYMLNKEGISLLEMLIILSITAIILLATTSLLPYLHHALFSTYRIHHLKQILFSSLISIEKDLKRAGYITNDPDTSSVAPLTIDSTKSCLLIIYDFDKKGHFIVSNAANSSIFGYRLKNRVLEYRRGTLHCQGSGWEKLTDAKEIKISQFTVNGFNTYYKIHIIANLSAHPQIQADMIKIVRRENN